MNMRWIFAVHLLAAGLLPFVAAPLHAAEDPFSRYLSVGSEDARAGRYASAKAEIEAAIEFAPGKAAGWYQLGLLYGQMGDFRDAELSFRKSIQLDPQSAQAHCRLGQTLVADPENKQDWAGAGAEFRAALKLDPHDAEAESLLGLAQMNLGQTEEAAATLRRALQFHPDEAAAHLNLALVLEQQPDGLAEAVKQYRAALAIKPDAPETEASLGELLARMGRLGEAKQAFRTALGLNPDLADAHFGLARLLKSGKNAPEAALEFEEAMRLQERTPDAAQAVRANNEAMRLAAQGDLSGSIRLLRQALQLKPEYGIAQYNLGLVLADSGDFAAAKSSLVKAVSLLPGEAKAWFELGRVLSRTGDQAGALGAVSWAVRLSPGNARFVAELASLRAQPLSPARQTSLVSDPQASIAYQDTAHPPQFGASSDTAAARLAFATELKAQGDFQGAIGELSRALVLAPQSSSARLALAQDYASLAEWDRAVEAYRKVLLVVEGEGLEDAGVHEALGEALLAGGHGAEAADQFHLVLKLEPDSAIARSMLDRALRASSGK